MAHIMPCRNSVTALRGPLTARAPHLDRFRVYGSDSFLDLVNATIERLRMKGVQILDYEKIEHNKVGLN